MKDLQAYSSLNPAYQERIHKAWKDFVDGADVHGRVPLHILEGWMRSRQACIDPSRFLEVPVLERAGFKDLCAQYAPLLNAAEPALAMLEGCIRNRGSIIILTAPSGHILSTAGDKDLLDLARAHYNLPGASRNLEHVGASAIGLCLEKRTPVQLSGFEHYNASLHNWRCASAPVLADASGIAASLTISGNITGPDIQAFALVTTFANYIGMRMRQTLIESSSLRLEALLQNAHDSVPYPLLVIDEYGMITHVNNKAIPFLTRTGFSPEGQDIASLLPQEDIATLAEVLRQPCVQKYPLTFLTQNGPQRAICTFTPIDIQNGQKQGMTLTLDFDAEQQTIPHTAASQNRDMLNESGKRTPYRAIYTFDDIIGKSAALKHCLDFSRRAALAASRIVIYGESGTGKELFAQAIHNAGKSRNGPFVAISCSAIPQELIESELFGHAEGAFTGARKGGMKGHLELANGGTLFLDEINSLPLAVQVKLLRVLQEMEFSPLGSTRVVHLDARVIAASNEDLQTAVREGRFRSDLFYRLNVVEVVLPPLRERHGDISLLAALFWQRLCARAELPPMTVAPNVLETLEAYDWPGNIRELENICERAWVMSDGKTITLDCLPDALCHHSWDCKVGVGSFPNQNSLPESGPIHQENRNHLPVYPQSIPVASGRQIEKVCRELVEKTLQSSGGNISMAAEALGIARSTLYRKMRKYGLNGF